MTERHSTPPALTPAMWQSWLSTHRPADDGGDGPGERVEAASGELPPPGVEALLSALSVEAPTRSTMRQALAVFAWEHAVGSDLRCALRDLDALWDVLEAAGQAPLARDQALDYMTEAWVDAVAAERGSPGIDPLSGLHTVGYLYGRIHELDRLSRDGPSPLVMLVVRWAPADGPWMRIARILQVGSLLRRHVRPGATLSQAGATMAIALVPDDARSREERVALAHATEADELMIADPRVDVFAVPDDRSELPDLVARLRPDGEANITGRSGEQFRHSRTTPLD